MYIQCYDYTTATSTFIFKLQSFFQLQWLTSLSQPITTETNKAQTTAVICHLSCCSGWRLLIGAVPFGIHRYSLTVWTKPNSSALHCWRPRPSQFKSGRQQSIQTVCLRQWTLQAHECSNTYQLCAACHRRKAVTNRILLSLKVD